MVILLLSLVVIFRSFSLSILSYLDKVRVCRQLVLVLVGLLSMEVSAQDIHYSQFYANPIYLNPALTGAAQAGRMGVNYRNQWPGINQSITSFSASFDTYASRVNSGMGLIFNRSQQSHTQLSISEIGISYAYAARLTDQSFLRLGGQVAYVDRDAYFGKLLFGSQIDDAGTISDFSGENLGADFRHQFVDYSAGLLYNSQAIWLGVSAHHLGQPNISFLDGHISQLPLKISAHGGIKFPLDGLAGNRISRPELTAAFNYKNQGPFQQLDLGMQLHVEPLVLGLWYRGLPVKRTEDPGHESLVALVGITLGNGLDVGYSYDYTISTLGNATSAGAHELSLRYTLASAFTKGLGTKTSMPCFKY